MTDANLYRSTLRRRSVSESDNDPMNSTANPRIDPSQFIPPDGAIGGVYYTKSGIKHCLVPD